MDSTLLTRRSSHAHRTPLKVLDEMTLTPGRVHELCGSARHTLAMLVARATDGPVFWISAAWATDRLNPEGMCAFAEPGRFTFLTPRQPIDLLWCLEEVLRAGVVPLVVADLPSLPGLTAVRRLHLAAETGAGEGMGAPLGLILTEGDGGAPGVESRWHMAPDHGSGRRAWHLSRRRARTLPPAEWEVSRVKGQFALERRAESAHIN
ncbi:ImuA family protein [Roseovarius phycicola]|uniref:Protein ImuA n=1 Tax=Roseovarius phycicola TaxID=3080976 RepID=A0ABZ2HMC9_9RHOB